MYLHTKTILVEFLGSTTVLNSLKSQKAKQNQNQTICASSHTIYRTVPSPTTSLRRQRHTPCVLGQKRANFRDDSKRWHSENGAWKTSYFFISSKIKNQGLTGCVTPQEWPKGKNPSPPLSPQAVPPILQCTRL